MFNQQKVSQVVLNDYCVTSVLMYEMYIAVAIALFYFEQLYFAP